jgi:FKBP-type peptidyl-prolyl cis-trans isomerase 2
MTIKKNDFIEIEFTGKIKEGEVFDSNIKEEIEKANLNVKDEPFIFCIGRGMFLKGVEDFLIGKEIKKQYKLELSPENAFGMRNPKLIQRIPSKVFAEHKLNPVQGEVLNFDGKIGKILSVSGGRVMVDFNNPLAGKHLEYKLKILRKIDNLNEKINSLNKFFFRKKIDFEVNDKKIILKSEKKMIDYIRVFKEKYKEIIGMDLEVEETSEKKEHGSKKDKK